MKFRFLLSTLAIITLAPSPALTRDWSSVAKTANQITVRIEGATQGSGVIINRKGNTYTILTAWHVLSPNRPGEDIDIITEKRTSYTSSIKKVSRVGTVDLATIEFTSNSYYPTAEIAKSLEGIKSDVIYISGYPISEGLDSIETVGNLIANADAGIDQGYQLIYTNTTKAGMSGGPIFNSNKELIGIHGRGEINQLKNNKMTSTIKTNINLGVPIYFYEQYINGMPIEPISNDAKTWDDYYALFGSLKAKAKISSVEPNTLDLVPTELKFLQKMIDTRPGHSLAYILKCGIETQGSWEKYSMNQTCQEGTKLITRYLTIMNEAWTSISANNPQFTLKKLSQAMEIMSTLGIETYMLRSRIIAGIGDPEEAIKIATNGLALAKDLIRKKVPLVASKDLGEDKHLADNMILSGLHLARGTAHRKGGNYKLAIDDLNAAINYHEQDRLQDSMPINERIESEVMILSELAIATMMETKNKRPTCKIYSRIDYLNSISGNPIENHVLKKLCDEFYSDKSMIPKAHTREGMDIFSKYLCSRISLFDAAGNLKSGDDFNEALKAKEKTSFDNAYMFVELIKSDPTLYSTFKSDDSLLAWAMSIVYNSSEICPDSYSSFNRPDIDFNWNGKWNQYLPRR